MLLFFYARSLAILHILLRHIEVKLILCVFRGCSERVIAVDCD